jgi:hypothetical protein
MWTNQTTLQTLTLLADRLGIEERNLSSILLTLPFSTALSVSLLGVQNYHTDNKSDIGEGHNTRGRKGALTTDQKTRKTSPNINHMVSRFCIQTMTF